MVALGKASVGMARAANRILRGRVEGVVVRLAGAPAATSPFQDVIGDHPIPGRRSVAAARAIEGFLDRTAPRPVLFLVSGGGSAMLERPAPPLRLSDLERTTRLLLGRSVPIAPFNAVRRHLSAVKGGRLIERLGARRSYTLAISDVVGDAPEEIASGPTVPDPTTFAEANAVVRAADVWDALPARVRERLRAGAIGLLPDTPKPGSPLFRTHRFHLIATNRDALGGAAQAAHRLGYAVAVSAKPVTGETAAAGTALGEQLRARAATARRPLARLSGGETTVAVGRATHRGGRNQELVLAAAAALAGSERTLLLSVGTDGIDGPTDAAGGWVDGRTVSRAVARGVDLDRALRRHESYYALRRLGGLWRTGPTGTNVADLHVGLVGPAHRGYGRK